MAPNQTTRRIGDNFPYLLRGPKNEKCQGKSWHQYVFSAAVLLTMKGVENFSWLERSTVTGTRGFTPRRTHTAR
jgi:hypothetical protein